MIKKFYDVFQKEEAYQVSKNDKNYIVANDEYNKSIDCLKVTLDEKQNKLLIELMDSINNLLDCESRIYFTSGFKIGAKFIMEIKEWS